MKIERFAADDMSGAMRIVKARFGPEAVILDNDRVGNKVELLAAIDYDESLLDKMPKLNDPIKPAARPTIELEALQFRSDLRELKALKSTLSNELTELRKRREPVAAKNSFSKGVSAKLDYLGFSPDVISSVQRHLPSGVKVKPSWAVTMKLVGQMIAAGDDEILATGGVVALLGATGVGKTTTTAKLAAQFAFRHGRDQVALITTDSLRIGSHEQLNSYARAIGVPMEIACNSQELGQKIEQYRDRKLVLIDTAGISQRDVHLAQHLVNVAGGAPKVKSCLVLSCTSQAGLAQEVTKAFGRIPLAAAIITKTDEAISMGPVLSGVIRAKLPVAYICNGQSVPEDIEAATRTSLLLLARGMADDNRKLSNLNYRGQLHG